MRGNKHVSLAWAAGRALGETVRCDFADKHTGGGRGLGRADKHASEGLYRRRGRYVGVGSKDVVKEADSSRRCG
jgi:hypothetical protein